MAKAVEVDRLAGGRILPHELILDALRPSLGANADRTPTPLRLFCRPFEDLLVEAQPKTKQKGRITRANAIAVWHWLSDVVLFDAVKEYSVDIKRLVLQGREAEGMARAIEFWTTAATAIRDCIAKDRGAARVALNGDVQIEDAEEMALLLSVGSDVVAIQQLLPRPAPQLTEEMLWALRDIHDRLAVNAADAAPYVAVIAMNRLAHPWEALKIPQVITNQTQDTLISSTDMGLVGDVLFANIELHGSAVRAVRHPVFDPDALIDHLAHFTELSSHIVREIEVRRGGKWGTRLLADRASVAEAMEELLEHARKDILAMLPVQHSGSYGGGPRCADLSKGVDDEKAERGLRYGKLLAGCAMYAAMGSFAAAQREALDEVSQYLRGYNEDLLKEMRLPEDEVQPGAERQFELAARLTEMVFGPEEGELLRRRGRAALAARAA
ncbi:MAG TPA: hypothetical protein VHE09_14845 [Rhizomicrobium sp.]|nr:hypothetical protein [Rhizomicrobium sp.]